MLQIHVLAGKIIIYRRLNPLKFIAGIVVSSGVQKGGEQGGLVEIVAALFEQGQLRTLFGAEIMHIANVVVDVVENLRRVVLQAFASA